MKTVLMFIAASLVLQGCATNYYQAQQGAKSHMSIINALSESEKRERRELMRSYAKGYEVHTLSDDRVLIKER